LENDSLYAGYNIFKNNVHAIEGGQIAQGKSLSYPLPIDQQFYGLPKEFFKAFHYDEGLNDWEVRPIDKITTGALYVDAESFSDYTVAIAASKIICVNGAASNTKTTVTLNTTESSDFNYWANAVNNLGTALDYIYNLKTDPEVLDDNFWFVAVAGSADGITYKPDSEIGFFRVPMGVNVVGSLDPTQAITTNKVVTSQPNKTPSILDGSDMDESKGHPIVFNQRFAGQILQNSNTQSNKFVRFKGFVMQNAKNGALSINIHGRHYGMVVRDIIFKNNTGPQFGGLYLNNIFGTKVDRCVFDNNTCTPPDSEYPQYGAGAVFINQAWQCGVEVDFNTCVFVDNVLNPNNAGGTSTVHGSSVITMHGDLIYPDKGKPEAGFSVDRDERPVTLYNCTIFRNDNNAPALTNDGSTYNNAAVIEVVNRETFYLPGSTTEEYLTQFPTLANMAPYVSIYNSIVAENENVCGNSYLVTENVVFPNDKNTKTTPAFVGDFTDNTTTYEGADGKWMTADDNLRLAKSATGDVRSSGDASHAPVVDEVENPVDMLERSRGTTLAHGAYWVPEWVVTKAFDTEPRGDGETSDNDFSYTVVDAEDRLTATTYDGTALKKLDADPGDGYVFGGWTGIDANTDANPVVTMNGDKTVTAAFNLEQYTVTVNNDGNGTTTPTPTYTAKYSVPQAITATATNADKYEFNEWRKTGGSGLVEFDDETSASTNAIVYNDDVTIEASWSIRNFDIPFVISPVGSGTVTENTNTISNGDVVNYDYDEVVALVANAATGATFTGWATDATAGEVAFSYDDPSVKLNANATITGAANIQALFAWDIKELTMAKTGEGTTTPAVSTTTKYDQEYDQLFTITASPDASNGYEFENWTYTGTTGDIRFLAIDGGTPDMTAPSIQAAIKSDYTITANFALREYTVSISDDGNGTVSPTGSQTFVHGEARSVTATPSTGYVFDHWEKSGTAANLVIEDANSATTNMTANGPGATVQAVFKPLYNVDLTIEGGINTPPNTIAQVQYTDYLGVTHAVTTDQTIPVPEGDDITFNFILSDSYEAKDVLINEGPQTEPLQNSYTVSNVTDNLNELSVRFGLKQYQITINNNGEQGTITPDVSEIFVNHGTSFTFDITANTAHANHYAIQSVAVGSTPISLPLERNNYSLSHTIASVTSDQTITIAYTSERQLAFQSSDNSIGAIQVVNAGDNTDVINNLDWLPVDMALTVTVSTLPDNASTDPVRFDGWNGSTGNEPVTTDDPKVFDLTLSTTTNLVANFYNIVAVSTGSNDYRRGYLEINPNIDYLADDNTNYRIIVNTNTGYTFNNFTPIEGVSFTEETGPNGIEYYFKMDTSVSGSVTITGNFQ